MRMNGEKIIMSLGEAILQANEKYHRENKENTLEKQRVRRRKKRIESERENER